MSKKGLGRGLGALIPEVEVSDQDREQIRELDVSEVVSNPNQPRKHFDQDKLEELAASLQQHGLVQPIVVRPKGRLFEIVAGERRWRAAQLAGLKKIPALVRDFSEAQTMEIALIENIQRQELNPIEEAEAYELLIKEFKLTQDELARRLGKSRPQITNTLRLLELSSGARHEVVVGRLSMGHAKVLLGVADAAVQEALTRKVIEEGLSVRATEEAVKRVKPGDIKSTPPKVATPKDPNVVAIENELRFRLGTPVRISPGEKKGRIEIEYFGDEDLGRLLEILGVELDAEKKRSGGGGRLTV